MTSGDDAAKTYVLDLHTASIREATPAEATDATWHGSLRSDFYRSARFHTIPNGSRT